MEANTKVNNCTMCKSFNRVLDIVGYDGICSHQKHTGELCTKNMFCSDYEPLDPTIVTDKLIEDTLQALDCCTDSKYDCSTCPFKGCKHTCQRDLMFAAKAVIEHLQILVHGYIVDQGIWLTVNKTLEKENKELWDSYHKGYAVGYAYGKQDALSADRPEAKTANEETENVK